MNEEKPVNIDKEIRKNYRKHFLAKTSIVSFLAIFVTASLALAYFFPFTILLTVPLLIMPLLLGFIIENMATNREEQSAGRMFRGFKMYFSNQFYGAFHILEGLIKALLVYMIFSSIMGVILHFSIGMNDPTYAQIIDNIMNRQNIGDLEKNLGELLENPTYILMANISEIVSIGLASYMLIHHVLTHSFKLFYNLLGPKLSSMYIINLLHKRTFRRIRKEFYSNYYSSFWYMIPVYVLLYTGGALLGLLVFNRTGVESAFIGIFAGTIVSMFFLPIVFDTLQLIFSLYGYEYLKTLLILQNDPLVGHIVHLPEKNRKDLEESIKAMEAMMKDVKEEPKEEKNDDKTKS